jgi:hypothetical protein
MVLILDLCSFIDTVFPKQAGDKHPISYPLQNFTHFSSLSAQLSSTVLQHHMEVTAYPMSSNITAEDGGVYQSIFTVTINFKV